MTENEAIEKIRKQICNEKGVQRYCRDNCMHGIEHCAYSMAIQALEKQIPKKPIIIDRRCENGDEVCVEWKCPVCGLNVIEEPPCQEYCQRCGNKLDWN